MDQHVSDERVMLQLAAGVDSSLGELMRRWEGPIWCFIDRMGGWLHCTDDIYQEVWTRVYLYRRRFKPAHPFGPYLFRIAANCCRDAMSRFHTRRMSQGPIDDPPPVSRSPAPDEALIADEGSALLHRAIARLPVAQRSVVLLYLVFSTDYGQIAAALGRAPGTVRSHMHYALRSLRGILARTTIESEAQVNDERLLR